MRCHRQLSCPHLSPKERLKNFSAEKLFKSACFCRNKINFPRETCTFSAEKKYFCLRTLKLMCVDKVKIYWMRSRMTIFIAKFMHLKCIKIGWIRSALKLFSCLKIVRSQSQSDFELLLIKILIYKILNANYLLITSRRWLIELENWSLHNTDLNVESSKTGSRVDNSIRFNRFSSFLIKFPLFVYVKMIANKNENHKETNKQQNMFRC